MVTRKLKSACLFDKLKNDFDLKLATNTHPQYNSHFQCVRVSRVPLSKITNGH